MTRIAPLLTLLLLLTISCPVASDSFTERRTSVGLKLFRSMLVANTTYQHKITDSGELKIKLIFINNTRRAGALKQSLGADLKVLRGQPVVLEVMTVEQYLKSKEKIMGVFIAQKVDTVNLQKVIDKSTAHQTMLFSPFKGDVEKGVLGGISVESKVRPFINMAALNKSKVVIKSFYLRVSKKYED